MRYVFFLENVGFFQTSTGLRVYLIVFQNNHAPYTIYVKWDRKLKKKETKNGTLKRRKQKMGPKKEGNKK